MHKSNYKDRPAIVVNSDSLVATILPEDGAKIASLRVKKSGKELLAVKKEEKYKVLTYEGDYVLSECSGFDDMFPTVDPYTPEEGVYQGITYPDHGETCRIAYEVSPCGDGVLLQAKSRLFPISYEKKIQPAEDGGIDILYRICNYGETAFPYVWAGHIMLQGEDGAKVIVPFTEDTITEMMFAEGENSESDLSKDSLTGYKPGVGTTYKFYYLEQMKEGCFGLSYPDGSRLLFEVNAEKLPYLGVWLNNGKFQDLYSIALEPCTVPYDAPDRAASRGYRSVIPAKDKLEFSIHISWK